MDLYLFDGLRVVICVDFVFGFFVLCEDVFLDCYCINLEIGWVKNVNKNLVVEKDIVVFEEEILR